MFSKGNKSTSRRPTPSIIGADCIFTGDILSEGEVQVDGRLKGDLRCHALIIGEKGSVTGEINAETVSVLGSVTGQITAQAVVLAKTAHILGDITHDSLSVEVGAYVEGRFNRLPTTAPGAIGATESTVNASGQALLSGHKNKKTEDNETSEMSSPPKVVLLGS